MIIPNFHDGEFTNIRNDNLDTVKTRCEYLIETHPQPVYRSIAYNSIVQCIPIEAPLKPDLPEL